MVSVLHELPRDSLMADEQGGQHHHLPETRGLCLSEEQTVSTVRGSS